MMNSDKYNSHPSLAELDLLRTNDAGAETLSHVSACEVCQEELSKLTVIAESLEVPEYEATFSESNERAMLDFINEHANNVKESTTTVAAEKKWSILETDVAEKETKGKNVTELLFSRHSVLLKVAVCFVICALLFFINQDEESSTKQMAKSIQYDSKDLDQDGNVDIADVYILAMKLDKGENVSTDFDLNKDLKINQQDLKMILIDLVKVKACMAQDRSSESRFATCDIYVDAKDLKLAAWQLELIYDAKKLTIVGIEGGEAEPFPPTKPPHYDSNGFENGRIILANLTTDKTKAKSGKIRVARLHLLERGSENFSLKTGEIVNIDINGKKIDAKIDLIRRK